MRCQNQHQQQQQNPQARKRDDTVIEVFPPSIRRRNTMVLESIYGLNGDGRHHHASSATLYAFAITSMVLLTTLACQAAGLYHSRTIYVLFAHTVYFMAFAYTTFYPLIVVYERYFEQATIERRGVLWMASPRIPIFIVARWQRVLCRLIYTQSLWSWFALALSLMFSSIESSGVVDGHVVASLYYVVVLLVVPFALLLHVHRLDALRSDVSPDAVVRSMVETNPNPLLVTTTVVPSRPPSHRRSSSCPPSIHPDNRYAVSVRVSEDADNGADVSISVNGLVTASSCSSTSTHSIHSAHNERIRFLALPYIGASTPRVAPPHTSRTNNDVAFLLFPPSTSHHPEAPTDSLNWKAKEAHALKTEWVASVTKPPSHSRAHSHPNVLRLLHEQQMSRQRLDATIEKRQGSPKRHVRNQIIVFVVSLFLVVSYIALTTIFDRLSMAYVVGLAILCAFLAFIMYEYECVSSRVVFFQSSFLYFYAAVLTHLPVVLSPIAIHLLHLSEQTTMEPIVPILFYIVVTCMYWLASWVVRMMSLPFIYVRFLYVTQLFRYLFWYVGFALTPLGVRFFLLLATMTLLSVLEQHSFVQDRIQRWMSRLFDNDDAEDDDAPPPPPPPLAHPLPPIAPPPPQDQVECLLHRLEQMPPGTIAEQSTEYHTLSSRHHLRMLQLMYDIRGITQDTLADITAIGIIVVLTAYLSWNDDTRHTNNHNNNIHALRLSDSTTYIRFASMVACRFVAQMGIHRVCNRRLQRAARELSEWSLTNASKRNSSLSIHLGMESLMRRNVLSALSHYLQNNQVMVYNVHSYLDHYVRDMGRVLTLDLSLINGLGGFRFLVREHLRLHAFYFFWMSVATMFAVLGGLDQTFRDVFWRSPHQ